MPKISIFCYLGGSYGGSQFLTNEGLSCRPRLWYWVKSKNIIPKDYFCTNKLALTSKPKHRKSKQMMPHHLWIQIKIGKKVANFDHQENLNCGILYSANSLMVAPPILELSFFWKYIEKRMSGWPNEFKIMENQASQNKKTTTKNSNN